MKEDLKKDLSIQQTKWETLFCKYRLFFLTEMDPPILELLDGLQIEQAEEVSDERRIFFDHPSGKKVIIRQYRTARLECLAVSCEGRVKLSFVDRSLIIPTSRLHVKEIMHEFADELAVFVEEATRKELIADGFTKDMG